VDCSAATPGLQVSLHSTALQTLHINRRKLAQNKYFDKTTYSQNSLKEAKSKQEIIHISTNTALTKSVK